jgi:hypothetical protein
MGGFGLRGAFVPRRRSGFRLRLSLIDKALEGDSYNPTPRLAMDGMLC